MNEWMVYLFLTNIHWNIYITRSVTNAKEYTEFSVTASQQKPVLNVHDVKHQHLENVALAFAVTWCRYGCRKVNSKQRGWCQWEKLKTEMLDDRLHHLSWIPCVYDGTDVTVCIHKPLTWLSEFSSINKLQDRRIMYRYTFIYSRKILQENYTIMCF